MNDYQVVCVKCGKECFFDDLQEAYDHGWFAQDGGEYCPKHAGAAIESTEVPMRIRTLIHYLKQCMAEGQVDEALIHMPPTPPCANFRQRWQFERPFAWEDRDQWQEWIRKRASILGYIDILEKTTH